MFVFWRNIVEAFDKDLTISFLLFLNFIFGLIGGGEGERANGRGIGRRFETSKVIKVSPFFLVHYQARYMMNNYFLR